MAGWLLSSPNPGENNHSSVDWPGGARRRARLKRVLTSGRGSALSGYVSPESESRAADAGFDRYLPKPATLDEITEVLARAPPGHGPGPGTAADDGDPPAGR
jgi:hypothetical protein